MRKVLVMGLLFGTLAAWNTGCTGDDDDDGHDAPDSITISGGTAVTVGSSLQLTATAVGGSEPGDVTTNSTWSTNSAGVATVGAATGLVTGVSAGTATISADHDGVIGQVTLTVSTAAAATFNASITGDWSGAHGNGVTMFVRVVDVNTAAVVYCVENELTETVGLTAGQIVAAASGVLVQGHTYRAEAIADVGGTGGVIDGTDHKYMSANAGPVAANATMNVPHSGGAPTWANGDPCP